KLGIRSKPITRRRSGFEVLAAITRTACGRRRTPHANVPLLFAMPRSPFADFQPLRSARRRGFVNRQPVRTAPARRTPRQPPPPRFPVPFRSDARNAALSVQGGGEGGQRAVLPGIPPGRGDALQPLPARRMRACARSESEVHRAFA